MIPGVIRPEIGRGAPDFNEPFEVRNFRRIRDARSLNRIDERLKLRRLAGENGIKFRFSFLP